MKNMYAREIEVFDTEYHDEILANMKESELATMPDVNKMDLQPEIDWKMRYDIINFMIYIHSNLRLTPHTLFLAVNIMDRYISKRIMRAEHKNLVICSCLSIAAKYLEEKRRVPSVSQIMKISGLQFTESQFTETELHILSTINYYIGHPTCEAFLDLILKDEPMATRHVARYICEMCLYDREFLKYGSSFIAYCAKMLVYQIFNQTTQALMSSIKSSDSNFQTKLWGCLSLLIKKLQNPSSYLHLKYSDKLLSNASNVVECFFFKYQQYKQEQLLQKREQFHIQQQQFEARGLHSNELQAQSPHSPFSSFGSFSGSGMESSYSSSPPNSPSPYSSFASTPSVLSSSSSLSLNSTACSSPASSMSSSGIATPITPDFPNLPYGIHNKSVGQGSHVGGSVAYELQASDSLSASSWNQPSQSVVSTAFLGSTSTSSASSAVPSLASFSLNAPSVISSYDTMERLTSMNQQQQMMDCFADFQHCNFVFPGSGNGGDDKFNNSQLNQSNLNVLTTATGATVTSLTLNNDRERERSHGSHSYSHPYASSHSHSHSHSQRFGKNDSLRKLSLSNLTLSSFSNRRRISSSSASMVIGNIDNLAGRSSSIA